MPEIPVTALHNRELLCRLEAIGKHEYILIPHEDLVKRQLLDYLSYSEQQEGPTSDCTWTIECKINGAVKGTGVAKVKKSAKEEAARQALAALRAEEAKRGR